MAASSIPKALEKAPKWMAIAGRRCWRHLLLLQELRSKMEDGAKSWFRRAQSDFYKKKDGEQEVQLHLDLFWEAFDDEFLNDTVRMGKLDELFGLRLKAGEMPRDFANRLDALAQAAPKGAVSEGVLCALFRKALGSAYALLEPDLAWGTLVQRAQAAAELGLKEKAKPTGQLAAVTVTPQANREAKETRARCWMCDKEGHIVIKCPTAQCVRCKQTGHLAVGCPTHKDPAGSFWQGQAQEVPCAVGRWLAVVGAACVAGRY